MYFHEKKSNSGKVLQLLQSYRNAEGQSRHHVVVSLGNAKIAKKNQKEIVLGVERKLSWQQEFELIGYSKETRKWIQKITMLIERKGSEATIQISHQSQTEATEEETELADGVKIDKVDHTHTTALGPALLGDIHTLSDFVVTSKC